MSQEPDPCSECSKPNRQFETSKTAYYANEAAGIFQNPFPVNSPVNFEKLSNEIYTQIAIEEICSNPGCSEGQSLLKEKLDKIKEDLSDGWGKINDDDITVLEQFGEGARALVDEHGIEWEDDEQRDDWEVIEDKIDELDETFTARATEAMAHWQIKNNPNPGKKEIPPIANALVNLHETRIDIKQAEVESRMDDIERYEEWEQRKGVSYTEEILAGVEQSKQDIEDLDELRERLSRYRAPDELEPLQELYQSAGSKSVQEQKEGLDTEHEQLHQLKQIEEGRRPNVVTAWYDEQIEDREALIEERSEIDLDGIPTDLSQQKTEIGTEQAATTEQELDEPTERIKNLEEKLQDRDATIENQKKKIQDRDARIEDLQGQVQDRDATIEDLRDNKGELLGRIEKLMEDKMGLMEENQDLNEELQREKSQDQEMERESEAATVDSENESATPAESSTAGAPTDTNREDQTVTASARSGESGRSSEDQQNTQSTESVRPEIGTGFDPNRTLTLAEKRKLERTSEWSEYNPPPNASEPDPPDDNDPRNTRTRETENESEKEDERGLV